MSEILIIGGTGFIGRNLVKRCLISKMRVTSLSLKRPNRAERLPKVNYIACNLQDIEKLKRAVKKDYDFVVNAGGNIDHNNKSKTYNSHYIGVKNLYTVLSKKKIKKFVQIGSSSEYGKTLGPVRESKFCKPQMIYGRSKLMASNFLLKKNKQEKFPITILRFFQVYGPFQNTNRLIPFVITSCLQNKSFSCSEGNQLRDFLYIDDAVDAILKSLSRKDTIGKIINIGCGKPIKVKKIIKTINSKIKKGKPIFGKVKLRIDESKKIYPNLTVAKKRLRWKSRTSIETGLNKTINFYKKKLKK